MVSCLENLSVEFRSNSSVITTACSFLSETYFHFQNALCILASETIPLDLDKNYKQLGEKPKLTYADPKDPFLTRLIINAIEIASGRLKFDKLYREVRNMHLPKEKIWSTVIEKLGLELVYSQEQLDKVPKEGPVIFVANHPFGVADGLALAHIVALKRPNFFIMVNGVLAKEEQVEDFLVPIDFTKDPKAKENNRQAGETTINRLRNGEAFLIFPSGAVATARNPFGKAEDFPWRRFVSKLVMDTKATVVPIFVHGQNSRIFQLASHIHMNLRLGFLMHELRNKMGKPLRMSIGDPIPFADVAHITERQKLIDHYRDATMQLGEE